MISRRVISLLVVALVVASGTTALPAAAAPGSRIAATAVAGHGSVVESARTTRTVTKLTPRERRLSRLKPCTRAKARRTPVRCRQIKAARAKARAIKRAQATPVVAKPVQPTTAAGSFTLAVVPDTQNEVFGADQRMRQRSEWLVANKDQLGLRFVDHIGDLVNWGWLAPQQYAVASAGMKPLEAAGIPYSISIGNHDTGAVGWDGRAGYGGDAYVKNPECRKRLGSGCSSPQLVRRTKEFNDTFTAARFGAVRGAYETGKVDNVWSTFTGGGRSWLVLSLELWARADVVEWARRVVAAHPNHNVIVSTHSYLDGDRAGIYGGSDYGATSPRYLWDRLVSQFPNVVMVLSGHVGSAAIRTDTGRHGNKVVSMLQSFHSADGNPVRLVTIKPDGSLDTRVVSPNGRGGDFSRFTQTVTGLTLR